ncbi:MAG: serine/threonine-protein kinase, partial [Myxococcota bacterium]
MVDRYLVLRPIGSGGAAQVYAVRHTVLDTVHALKVLRLGGAAARERLVREGRVQARLDPAHVVPVTDVIDVFGAPALVLPLVDGCSLDVALADRRPTLDEATALFRAIVDGVACAHRVGVVHRDLKPSNVLLDRVGERVRVRVADFGIAKAGELGRPDPPTADGVGAAAGSTQGFVGTPAYAAPEQLGHAGQAEAPADVWSLGVILHELTTGARPSPEGPPVPPPLDGLARALLRPDPAERPSIGWVAEALDALGVPDALGPGSALSTWLGAHRVSVAASTPAPEVERTVRLPSRMERLPADRDPFVGRAAELDALDAQLRLARWVTLTGIGGVGKTRLALAAARRFAGEGIVADLTEARSVADLGHALARALDVPLGAGDPVEGI